jgi:peptidyl-prolyl cis-trans isomerase D
MPTTLYIRILIKKNLMAIFEKIRKRSGLVILVIGTALAAFILGEFLNSGSSMFDSDQDAVGFINGNKISYFDFNKDIENLRLNNQQVASFSAIQLSEVVWNQTLTKEIIGTIQKDLGFTISTEELWDQITLNPSIQQMDGFRDPKTGLFDQELLKSTLANLRDNRESSPEANDQWLNWVNFESNVRDEAMTNKFYSAVQSGLNIPVSLQNYENSRNIIEAEIEWFGSLTSELDDSISDLTESDYQAVYDMTKEDFKVDSELRDMLFADFPINPSDEDRALAYDELLDLKSDFENSEDDSLFVMANSDLPFQDVYSDLELLDLNLRNAVKDRKEGFVSEPLETGNGYQILKIMDRRSLPDSVKARHILISFEGAERSQVARSFNAAKAIADSIFEILNSGVISFESANGTLNDDTFAGSQGGDLGWFKTNRMAKPFEDFCFRNNIGDLGLVLTNFGFHIINITDQNGQIPSIKLAQVFRRVSVSKETEQGIYKRAAEFAKALQSGDNAQDIAKNYQVMILSNNNTNSTDQSIAGLQGDSREIVKWLFNEDRSVGDVGIVNNGYKNYVVSELTAVYKPGYKPLEYVKDELKTLALNRSKVNYLFDSFEKSNVDESTYSWKNNAVSLTNNFIPSVGRENIIIGQAVGSNVGYESKLLKGENGVFKYRVLNKSENSVSNFSAAEVASQVNLLRSRVQSQLLESLVDASDIQDNRGRFF